jgi:hypothetical protein
MRCCALLGPPRRTSSGPCPCRPPRCCLRCLLLLRRRSQWLETGSSSCTVGAAHERTQLIMTYKKRCMSRLWLGVAGKHASSALSCSASSAHKGTLLQAAMPCAGPHAGVLALVHRSLLS